MSTPQDIPAGTCHCGCGQTTTVIAKSDRSKGTVRGESRRYLYEHRRRSAPADYLQDEHGCWIWQRTVDPQGYGRKAVQRPTGRRSYMAAHRYMWEKEHGPIPDGLQLDHLCRNRACVNPTHLEPVTGQTNTQRSATAKLDPDKVRELRRMAALGASQTSLSKYFGVAPVTIREAINRVTWTNVEDTA